MHLVVITKTDIRVIDHLMLQVVHIYQLTQDTLSQLVLMPFFDLEEFPLVLTRDNVTDIITPDRKVTIQGIKLTGSQYKGLVHTATEDSQQVTILALSNGVHQLITFT